MQPSDFEALLPYSLHEPENWLFGLENAAGEENLRKYLDTAWEQYQNKQSYPYIIFDKHAGTYVGSTRFYQINVQHGRLAIGYSWLGNAYKGTGINSHVKYLMLEYAFDVMNFERVEFFADTLNERSIRSILSLGAQREGTLRSHAIKPDGNRRDTAVFSILKKEWLEQVKPSLWNRISS